MTFVISLLREERLAGAVVVAFFVDARRRRRRLVVALGVAAAALARRRRARPAQRAGRHRDRAAGAERRAARGVRVGAALRRGVPVARRLDHLARPPQPARRRRGRRESPRSRSSSPPARSSARARSASSPITSAGCAPASPARRRCSRSPRSSRVGSGRSRRVRPDGARRRERPSRESEGRAVAAGRRISRRAPTGTGCSSGVCGAPKICCRRADLVDAAGVHEDDAVGHLAREAHLVRDHQQRHAVVGQRLDDAQHLADQLGVERRGDLVAQQHGRLHRQRARDRHALLLAAGELVRAWRRTSRPGRRARAACAPAAPASQRGCASSPASAPASRCGRPSGAETG